MLPFVFEQFALQTVAIRKNLFYYYFLYLNGFQCKPLQLKITLFNIIFVFERFAVQTVDNYGNVIYF